MGHLLLLTSLQACRPPYGDDWLNHSGSMDDSADDDRDGDGDGWEVSQDCNDGDPEVHPAAAELCNSVDDDCDGAIDEESADATWWYSDTDGDGYGDPNTGALACEQPDAYVPDGTDCDDTDPLLTDARDLDCPGPAAVDNEDATFVIYDDWFENWSAYGSAMDGDVDGDGRTDLVVGMADPEAYNEYYSYIPRGWVHVFTGFTLATGSDLTFEDADAVLEGATSGADELLGEFAGYAIAYVGDMDEGGGDDLAIGAPRLGTGSVYLLRGEDLAGLGTVSPMDLAFCTLSGENDRQLLGSAVTSAGDVNGDGFLDVGVGGPGPWQGGSLGTFGSAYVLFGRPGGCSGDLSVLDADVSIRTPEANVASMLGATLVGATDYDGDGLDDLVVGDTTVADGAGAVLGYLGSSLTNGASLAPDDADFRLGGEQPLALVGAGLASGDANGDGHPDLAVRAEGRVADTEQAGSVFVVYNDSFRGPGAVSLASADVRLTPANGGWRIGNIAMRNWYGSGPWLWVTGTDGDAPSSVCLVSLATTGSYAMDDCAVEYTMPTRALELESSLGDIRGNGGLADTLISAPGDDSSLFLFIDED